MAYQTLGNRVLGGIGAPGGGMAESFNAGVNTSLNQRTARQNMDATAQTMAIRQQELKWKEEDRKIAAQQRAAAAAARARAEAAMKAIAAGQSLTPKTGAVPPGMNAGPVITKGNVAGIMPPGWFGPQTGTAAPAGTPNTTSSSFKTSAPAPVGTGLGVRTAPAATAKTSAVTAAPVVTAGVKTTTAPAPAVTAKTPAPVVTAKTPAPVATGAVGNMQFVMPKDSWLWPGIKAGQTVTLTPSGSGYTVTMPNGQKVALNKDTAAELLAEQGSSIEAVLAAQTPAPAATVVPTTPAPAVPPDFNTTAPAPVGTQPAPAGLPVIKLPGVGGVTLELNPDGSSRMIDAQGSVYKLTKPETEELLTMAGTTAPAVRAGQAYPPTDTGQTLAQQISGYTQPVREGAVGLADRAAGQITGMATGLYGATAGLTGLGASAMGFPEFGQAAFDVAGNAFSSAARQGNEGLFGSNAPGNFTTSEPAPVGVQPAPVGVQPAPPPPPPPAYNPLTGKPTGVPYGPSLGAAGQPAATAPGLNPTTNTAAERIAANPVDQAAPTPDSMAYVMEPGRPGREMQQAIDMYNELARQAQIYSDYGQTAEFAATVAKMKEAENTLYHLQGMQALQDLAFNSPQRLEAVLGEQFGRTVAIQPNPNGNWDIYADGKKALELSKDELSNWARGQIDTGFAAAEAERVAKQNEEVFKSSVQQDREIAVADAIAQNTLRLELTKADIDAIKAANNADIEIQKALAVAQIGKDSVVVVDVTGQDGGVVKVVFNPVTRKAEGYFTLVDPADPSRPLTTPIYVSYKQ